MDRFRILKNPDQRPCHSYALTPEEKRLKEEEERFKKGRARRPPQDIDRESIISQYLRTAQGRQTLAASMANPLRQRMDMGSLARRIFRVDPLPAGAFSVYPRVNDNPVYVVGENGQRINTITSGQQIFIPEFEISSNPQIALSSIQQRRFALIERAQDLAYQEIRRTEESLAFQVLDASSTSNRNIQAINFDSGPTISRSLMDSFADIESHGLRVARMFMNAVDYSNIRRNMESHLDQNNTNYVSRTGILASLWGAQIQVSRIIPAGTIYLTSEPQHVGVLPLRTDLTVLPADNPEQMTLGWSVSESIGMGCFNPRGVARITIAPANSFERTVETIRHIGFGDEIAALVPGNTVETPEPYDSLLNEIFRS